MVAEAVDTAALDAWLAEHLFDGSPLDCIAPGHEGSQCWSIPTGPTHFAFIGYGSAPAYSTTGDGMLMVLEALWARKLHVFIEIEGPEPDVMVSDPHKGTYNADGYEYRVLGHRRHEKIATAVALAAKAALEDDAARAVA